MDADKQEMTQVNRVLMLASLAGAVIIYEVGGLGTLCAFTVAAFAVAAYTGAGVARFGEHPGTAIASGMLWALAVCGAWALARFAF